MGLRTAIWRVACGVICAAATGLAAQRGDGAKWLGREYELQTWQHRNGLPSDRVWGILQGRDGFLWVATQRGVARFDGLKFRVFDHNSVPEMVEDDSRSILEDGAGRIWISTTRGVLRKSGDQFKRFEDERHLFLEGAPAMCARRKGGIWVGGPGWVGLIEGESVRTWVRDLTLPKVPTPTPALQEDEAGNLWIGSQGGLFLFDAAREQFVRLGLGSELENKPVFGLSLRAGEPRVVYADGVPRVGEMAPRAWMAVLREAMGPAPRLEQKVDIGSLGRTCFLVNDLESVWMPAPEDGVLRYERGRLETWSLHGHPRMDFALSACVDQEGNLWVGTESSGLQRWTSRPATQYTMRDGLPHDNVWTICEARDGGMWIGTDGGVSRFRDGRFTTLLRRDGSGHDDVRSIAEDAQGSLWIGTIRSLEQMRDGQMTPVKLPGEWFETKIRVLHPGRDGALWIGTVRGLTRWEEGNRTKYGKGEGLGSEEVCALLEDRAGSLWVGTLRGGLSRLQGRRWTTWCMTNGLSSDTVWALYEDAEGVLWAGSDRGLNRFQQGRWDHFTEQEGLPDNEVNCIVEDGQGRLWVGHDRGIYSVEKRQFEEVMRRQRGRVQAVEYGETDGLAGVEVNGQKSNPVACRSPDGRLWFPTTSGVAVIDPARTRFDQCGPPAIIEEVRAEGKVVLGEDGGSEGGGLRDGRLWLPAGSARVLEFRCTTATFVAPEKARFKYRLAGLAQNWIEAGTRREVYFADLRPGDYRFELMACNRHGVWGRPSTLAFQIAPFFYQTAGFYLGCGLLVVALVAAGTGWRLREIRRIHHLEQLNALNEQRRRIARDIHDELGASLTHILQLSGETRRNLGDTIKVDRHALRIAALAEEAVDNIGQIVWANNPEFDRLEDLVAYLREFAARFLAETDIQVQCDFPKTVPPASVSGLLRRHLVLVLKESLQNIVKHAAATEVRVGVSLDADHLELRVDDNGRGWTAQEKVVGNGLVNMRQRMVELGGTFEVQSEPGKGTRLRVRVQL